MNLVRSLRNRFSSPVYQLGTAPISLWEQAVSDRQDARWDLDFAIAGMKLDLATEDFENNVYDDDHIVALCDRVLNAHERLADARIRCAYHFDREIGGAL